MGARRFDVAFNEGNPTLRTALAALQAAGVQLLVTRAETGTA